MKTKEYVSGLNLVWMDFELPEYPTYVELENAQRGKRKKEKQRLFEEFNEQMGKYLEYTEGKLRAGAVIELKNGEVYLLGDVNYNLGVCDDCMLFAIKDIARIAYLY